MVEHSDYLMVLRMEYCRVEQSVFLSVEASGTLWETQKADYSVENMAVWWEKSKE
jgi:hypothetical protein